MAEKERSSGSDAGGSVEAELMRELRFGGIDEENLKELVRIVAGIKKTGLKAIKVFPRGIPVPNGIRVSGILSADEINKSLPEILGNTPQLGGITLFPLGIPFPPEWWTIGIDLGPTVETRPPIQF